MTAAETIGAPSADDIELRREAERISQLIDDLGTIGGAPVRERADELVRRLVHLYGTGLSSLLDILTGGTIDAATKARLNADPLVSSLLVLHGVHPDPEAARAFDPSAEPKEAPTADAAARLIQIDLGHHRSIKAGDTP